jgi:hypothetical protein
MAIEREGTLAENEWKTLGENEKEPMIKNEKRVDDRGCG